MSVSEPVSAIVVSKIMIGNSSATSIGYLNTFYKFVFAIRM